MTPQLLLQMLVTTVGLSLGYMLIASGLSLVYGIMHMVNLAHGAIFMFGGMVAAIMISEMGLNFFAGIVITIIVFALFGVIFEKVIFRPLRGLWLAGFMASFGASLTMEGISWRIFGTVGKHISLPLKGVISLFGVHLSVERLIIIGIGAIVMIGLYYLVYRTKLGRQMRAIEEDEEAAKLQGVSTDMVSSLAMAIGCALAAVAGVLFTAMYYVDPSVGFLPMLKAFNLVIIGGLGSLTGTAIAAIIMGIIESFGGTLLGAEAAYGMTWALLMLVVIIRPRGIMGVA